MNKGVSRNKKKRSQSPPLETNNSFMKNVTSTVSYLLPSSITKWFSTPSTSNANGSNPTSDQTDSSSEDEIQGTSVVVQPPPKRMRYNSGKLNHLGQSEVNYATGSINNDEPFDITQPSTSRNHFKREPNYVSTPIHTVVNEPSNENRERDTTVIKSHHSLSTKGSTVTRKRKSLFDMLDKDSTKNKDSCDKTCKKSSSFNDYRQPCFNIGLAASSYYRAKLAYAGAASTYLNKPNIKSSKTTRIHETSQNDNTISYSARRVMDLLEHYSSPLLEAKRMSPYITSQNKSNESKSFQNSISHSYKTQELHVPTIASILSLKKRSRLMDSTNAARQIIASHSSSTHYSPYQKSRLQSEVSNTNASDKLTTKIKNKITRTKIGGNVEFKKDFVTPVKLPTAVLEIDQNNLPKFNFGNPAASTSSSLIVSSGHKSQAIQSLEVTKSIEINLYNFETPLIVSTDVMLASTAPKFTFEYPTTNVDEFDDNKEKEKSSPVLLREENNSKLISENPKDWSCPDCWVVNKADATNCVCCSAKKPSQENKLSYLCPICKTKGMDRNSKDECSKCTKAQRSNGNIMVPVIHSQCRLENPLSTQQSSHFRVIYPTISEQNVCYGSITSDQCDTTESHWKCNDCWVNNQSNVDKCIACGGVKPNSQVNSKPSISLNPTSNLVSSSFKVSDKIFENILKAQTDKWECSNCLVRNDSDKTKCVCCETEKSGVTKDAKKTGFNFGMNTNTTFKFGIDPMENVDNFSKDMESEECVEQSSAIGKWETNNNVLPETPRFSFGLPENKITEKIQDTSAINKLVETPKLNFTFGIPNQTPLVSESKTDVPENNIRETESRTISEEISQEVPTVNLKLSNNEEGNVIAPQNIFESHLPSQESLPKILNSNTSVVAGSTTLEKNMTFKPFVLQPTIVETNKSNTFTFTQTGLNIPSNLFSIATTTIANASSSNNSTILTVTSTTSSSLFQTSETNANPALALFQRVEPVPRNTNLFLNPVTTTSNVTSAPTLTASSNLFSFGNNTQISVSEPGISKFNFSFGNTNKTDTSPMFNATFGLNKSSNTSSNSNTFSLAASAGVGNNAQLPGSLLSIGSELTSGHPIISNTLSGNNGLTTGNPLGVPDLGNTTLNEGNGLKSSTTLSTTPSSGLFGGVGEKENAWSNTNNAPGNLFVSNATTNTLQRPATFTFGAATPFNANNAGTSFGNNASNAFTMQSQGSTLPTLFSNSPQSQAAPSIFGNPQTTSSPAPTMSVFGSTNPSANSFNAHNQTIPTFETQLQNPVPAPSFNFGTQLNTGGVFGFGQQPPTQPQQQQQQQQQFQSPVYNFGSSQGTPQFNMGSAPNTTVRRVRRAVRRSTQR